MGVTGGFRLGSGESGGNVSVCESGISFVQYFAFFYMMIFLYFHVCRGDF